DAREAAENLDDDGSLRRVQLARPRALRLARRFSLGERAAAGGARLQLLAQLDARRRLIDDEVFKLGRLVGARLTGASDAQGAGGLRLDAVFFEKAPGRRRAARTALARERLFAVAEVFQNVSAQASLV